MITDDYFVEPATWRFDESAIRAIRTEVFIVEQQVPEDEEWDDDDPTAQHFLALDQTGSAIGTARLTRDGRIGRVAVLKDWRGKKVGDALLRAAVEEGRLDMHEREFQQLLGRLVNGRLDDLVDVEGCTINEHVAGRAVADEDDAGVSS